MDEKEFRDKFPLEVEKALRVISDTKNVNHIPDLVFVAAMAEAIEIILNREDIEETAKGSFDAMKSSVRRLLNERLK